MAQLRVDLPELQRTVDFPRLPLRPGKERHLLANHDRPETPPARAWPPSLSRLSAGGNRKEVLPPFFSGSSQMVGSEIGAHAPRSTHSPFECADVFVPAGWIPFHDGLRRAQERKFGELTTEELAEYRRPEKKSHYA